MGFLLAFLLLFIFFFPALIMPLILFLSVIFLIYIPFKFTFNSLAILVQAPGQIYHIATNPALRKNHALEHATINVLEERYGRGLPLAGYAEKNGFFIKGWINSWEVEDAAREGLRRLQQGENKLAIHQRCGSTLLVANLVASILFLVFLFMTGIFNFIYLLFALILANIVGSPLGVIMQRYLTTSTNVDGLYVKSIEVSSPRNIPYDMWFFVRTAQLRTVEVEQIVAGQ